MFDTDIVYTDLYQHEIDALVRNKSGLVKVETKTTISPTTTATFEHRAVICINGRFRAEHSRTYVTLAIADLTCPAELEETPDTLKEFIEGVTTMMHLGLATKLGVELTEVITLSW